MRQLPSNPRMDRKDDGEVPGDVLEGVEEVGEGQ